MESSQHVVVLEHKTVAGRKDIQIACTTWYEDTFLNAADVSSCGMCGTEMKSPTHDVQADGSWKCGGCKTVNRRRVKECLECRLPFSSLVTTAAPAQIFCSRCGFLNDGGNDTCVQCDCTIRSTLDKISTDLRDSTNFLARDMGVNIHVKCPGCLVVCYVPPATACLRCGTCYTYFASPSVGEVTNFHMNRLASSISSSFMGFFRAKRGGQDENEAMHRQEEAREAPIGRLIAAGNSIVKPPCHSSALSDASELCSNLQESEVFEDEMNEEKRNAVQVLDYATEPKAEDEPLVVEEKVEATSNSFDKRSSDTLQKEAVTQGVDSADHVFSSSMSAVKELPVLARSMPLRAALPPPRQELIQVEGDIVEL